MTETTNTVPVETSDENLNTVPDETWEKVSGTVPDETLENVSGTVPDETLENVLYESLSDNFAEMSEVDIAYRLLTEAGKDNPAYFKALIRTIIKLKGKTVQNEAAAISEIYTMINMDSRFQHMGDGKWGLTDWNPPETKRASRSRSASAKSSS